MAVIAEAQEKGIVAHARASPATRWEPCERPPGTPGCEVRSGPHQPGSGGDGCRPGDGRVGVLKQMKAAREGNHRHEDPGRGAGCAHRAGECLEFALLARIAWIASRSAAKAGPSSRTWSRRGSPPPACVAESRYGIASKMEPILDTTVLMAGITGGRSTPQETDSRPAMSAYSIRS
jgi:hypothetical protein